MTVASTLGTIQQGVRDHVERPPTVAGLLGGRAAVPPVHFDIGLSTATVVDDPVVGFGSESGPGDRKR